MDNAKNEIFSLPNLLESKEQTLGFNIPYFNVLSPRNFEKSNVVNLGFYLSFSFLKNTKKLLIGGGGILILFLILHLLYVQGPYSLLISALAVVSIGMILQASFTLWWMLYAWDHPERSDKNKSPKIYIKPELSFTAIIPARNEEMVIGETLRAVASIDYPEELKETVVVCRNDDVKTIFEVKKMMSHLGKGNIKLAIFEDFPINKPHALNIGLNQATKDVVVIFDAEDEPHKDIFNIANTVMRKGKADVLQSGVQLMNYRSTWFSTLNVLEYYFWFKSTLQFFANVGIIPLGGNTVFFRKKWLDRIDGWDETCLTEDADIGIRLSAVGAKIRIVYDEKHVTQEESPLKLSSFIKQRTRWDQGFIQIFTKGNWLNTPRLTQRFLACYILISPELQTFMFLYIPISFLIAFYIKLPVWLTLISAVPLYLLILQQVVYNIGLYLYTKDYSLKYTPLLPLKIFVTFFPFQFILGISATRAMLRIVMNNNAWEKTQHSNAHRIQALYIAKI